MELHQKYGRVVVMRIKTIVLLVGLVGLVGCSKTGSSEAPELQEPVACTLEAKVCPDGSSVGRVPPNCEFEECSGNNSL